MATSGSRKLRSSPVWTFSISKPTCWPSGTTWSPILSWPNCSHCELDRGYVRVDELQQTSVKGIYCVGESTGIGGVDKAQIEGCIAGLAVAGKPDASRRLTPARDRQMRFVRCLADAFALRDELRHLPEADTLVCRCEDVPFRDLAECDSWRQAKLHTRCGMGPCQGRICGAATEFLFGWKAPVPRPPLFPAEVATLAGAAERCAHAGGLTGTQPASNRVLARAMSGRVAIATRTVSRAAASSAPASSRRGARTRALPTPSSCCTSLIS